MKNLLQPMAFTAAAFFASTAFAKGVVIEMTHSSDKRPSESAKVMLDGDKCRVETKDAEIVFRGDKGVLWIAEANEKTYMEVTKEDMKKAAAAMSGAMAQMQAQMASLPPEQRAMMEQMMAAKGMPPPGAAKPGTEKREYKPNGKSETVNGYATKGYDALKDGKKESELWVADWKVLDLKKEDFKCFEMIGEMMEGFAGGRPATPFSERFGEGGLPGIPVKTVRTGAWGTSTEELKKVSREDLGAAKFEEPKGRTKRTMREMMNGQ